MTSSAAFFRSANILTLDYPYQAAIASALAIVDEACIVVGQSQDETYDAIYALQDIYGWQRIKIREERIVYDRGWQERWWDWCCEMTDADWRLWLDLDEVIPPAAAPWLHETIADDNINLVRFPFVHFYATPRYVKLFPLTHNTRLGRATHGVGFRMVNFCDDEHPTWSACAMRIVPEGVDAHGYQGQDILDCPHPILHYGWCRDAQALAISQAKHHAWYADGDGLEDGHLPEVVPYDYWGMNEAETGIVVPVEYEHPPEMAEWMDAHAAAWSELERMMA